MPKISVIIPCYNEEHRLQKEVFISFLQTVSHLQLILVNDGSSDKTATLLEEIRTTHPEKVVVISYPGNKGKANAIYKGFQEALYNSQASYIGYLDADLSTSFETMLELVETAQIEKVDYIFGSRVKMLNHVIVRSNFRHFCGRVLATVIDSRYRLHIYDTQCGAKLFTADLIRKIIHNPFYTRWLFDVEIFLRIRSTKANLKGMEYPLPVWMDPGKSKISLLSFVFICRDLIRLVKNYKRRL